MDAPPSTDRGRGKTSRRGGKRRGGKRGGKGDGVNAVEGGKPSGGGRNDDSSRGSGRGGRGKRGRGRGRGGKKGDNSHQVPPPPSFNSNLFVIRKVLSQMSKERSLKRLP